MLHLRLKVNYFFIDGLSDDGTYEWLKNALLKQLITVNFLGTIKSMLVMVPIKFSKNTKGEFISRLDGHTIYPETYFTDAIEVLKNKHVDVVGGPANHIGFEWRGKVIANCMMHPFGVGNSKFRTSNKEQYVDTVPFPIYKRDVLKKYRTLR